MHIIMKAGERKIMGRGGKKLYISNLTTYLHLHYTPLTFSKNFMLARLHFISQLEMQCDFTNPSFNFLDFLLLPRHIPNVVKRSI